MLVLEKHGGETEGGVGLDQPVGGGAVPLAHESVEALDAVLGVQAVAAEVPLAGRTVGAGHGVGAADDAGDEVACCEARAGRRRAEPAHRFVAEQSRS